MSLPTVHRFAAFSISPVSAFFQTAMFAAGCVWILATPCMSGQTMANASPVLNASRWALPELSGMLFSFQIAQAFF